MTGVAVLGAPEDWRTLRLLSLYRLLLILLLVIAYEAGYGGSLFVLEHPRMFRYVCNAYVLLALLALLPLLRRAPGLRTQTLAQCALDTLSLTLLVYANGGVSNGLGILLITPVLSGSMLLERRLAAVLAAGATLAMFAEEIVRQSAIGFSTTEFTNTGLLGLMFFASAGISNTLAQRARRGEALAQRAGSDLASLALLNARIIENMPAGVLVVDSDGRIRTGNAAAQRLLGQDTALAGLPLSRLTALHEACAAWTAGTASDLLVHAPAHELIPHFSRMSWGPDAPLLILLEDAAVVRERAQQLKLAALGRLSAAIAHEIRNPLAAITGAGQLLSESGEIRGENQRLLAMIQRHGQRINKIVGDVLDLSRRDAASPSQFALKPWLVRAIGQYQEGHVHSPRPVDLLEVEPDLQVRFDPHHLQQVLFNLLDNSFEHGGDRSIVAMIGAGLDEKTGQPWLEVRDNGPGIPAELQERVFEPFFTTAREGTGLGLYLSRELCDYNQARLTQVPQADGACFRILFGTDKR